MFSYGKKLWPDTLTSMCIAVRKKYWSGCSQASRLHRLGSRRPRRSTSRWSPIFWLSESPNSKEFNVRTGLTVLAVALVIPRTAPMVIKYEGKPGTRPLPGPKWVLGSIQLGSWTDDHDDTFVRD
ncbi:unnamed protein product [Fusarium graminearum]|nr:unnamed protein product [Fusarium graminearum]